MRFGSLFTGIGGLDLGLERAGMECAWQVEINDYCIRVLEKHWPDVRKYGNVREVGKHNLEAVDLIAGGFPCQPHSVAGKRRGAEDDRNLWPEFIRIIRETRPRYVLGENVLGIATAYLDTVLSDLEGEGYTCTTFNIPACAFDAPHRRERIFIVAHNTNGGGEDQIEGMATRNPADTKRVRGDVADTNGTWELQPQGCKPAQRRWSCDEGWWTVEPDVGRVAYGVPSWVDRIRGLGNAVVPQVAEWIGRGIMEHEVEIQN